MHPQLIDIRRDIGTPRVRREQGLLLAEHGRGERGDVVRRGLERPAGLHALPGRGDLDAHALPGVVRRGRENGEEMDDAFQFRVMSVAGTRGVCY